MSERDRLLYKYAHVGCPAAHMEDNCAHPGDCADNGRCRDLPPLRPYCKKCGWCKGGPDSWDGVACKCGETDSPIRRVE